MKYLFLLVAILLVTQPVAAQVPRLDSLTAPLAAAPDTVAALHRLFIARRHSLRVLLPLTAAIGAGIFVAAAQTHDVKEGLNWTLLGVTTVGFTIGELASLVRYSKDREDKVMEALEQRHLPASLRRELRPEYFRPTKAVP